MSKRISTSTNNNGTVITKTKGSVEGTLPNFDAFIVSPPTNFKKATEMQINLDGVTIHLTGRNFRTLSRLCRTHEDAID